MCGLLHIMMCGSIGYRQKEKEKKEKPASLAE
jgi:hypothetical protein